jgi:hypothetical protein
MAGGHGLQKAQVFIALPDAALTSLLFLAFLASSKSMHIRARSPHAAFHHR